MPQPKLDTASEGPPLSTVAYLLMPVAGFPEGMAEFSYEHPTRLEACRFETIHALVPANWQGPRIVLRQAGPGSDAGECSLIRQIPSASAKHAYRSDRAQEAGQKPRTARSRH